MLALRHQEENRPMSDLLAHLNRETLPAPVVEAFVQWCIWEQARPALVKVLEVGHMTELVNALNAAGTPQKLAEYGELANEFAKRMQGNADPKMLSAAEAAAFEFNNMNRAAQPDHYDPEAVAFFAARVCGWAEWAKNNFADAEKKNHAEESARADQETTLENLWREAASGR